MSAFKIQAYLKIIKKKCLFFIFLFLTLPVWFVVFLEIFLWFSVGTLIDYCTCKAYQKKIFQYSKRFLDICVSITILFIITPFMLAIGLCNFIILGRPIFFIQPRVGLSGILFSIIKFRSMRQNNRSGKLIPPNEIQLCTYGKFIRSYSLDELPSLWNVLKGDISLVGPRPLVPEFITHNVPVERHDVRPGLTGFAQINGRNALLWHEKFAYDLYYVHHQNYLLDTKILLRTLYVLCSAEHTQIACTEKFFP